jgi:hypothetical protein
LSDDDDDAASACPPGENATIERVVSAVDDTREVGKAPTKANILGPIGVGGYGTTRPTAADQAPVVPTLGAHGRNHLRIATKQSNSCRSADQVMHQVELPPYRVFCRIGARTGKRHGGGLRLCPVRSFVIDGLAEVSRITAILPLLAVLSYPPMSISFS